MFNDELDPFKALANIRSMHPDLSALDKIKFSRHVSGYEWIFGKTLYVPRSFRYKYNQYGRNLNINEFMAAKLTDISRIKNEDDRIHELTLFSSNYINQYIKSGETVGRNYTLGRQMPLARENAASYWKHGHYLQDIDALEKSYKMNFGKKLNYQQSWANEMQAQGLMIDPLKSNEFIVQQNLVSDLMPGMKGAESVTKYSTLENKNILGRASWFNAPATLGAEMPMSITPAMIEVAQKLSEAHLYGSAEEHILNKAQRLTTPFMTNQRMVMTQFGTSAHLAGDPLLYSRGLMHNWYSFPEKDIFLSRSELSTFFRAANLEGTEVLNPASASHSMVLANLEGTEVLNSASASHSMVLANLMNAGIAPSRARNMMKVYRAIERGDIAATKKSKYGTRITYYNRQKLGPGSKFNIAGRKAIGAEVHVREGKNLVAGGWNDILLENRSKLALNKIMSLASFEADGNLENTQDIYNRATKADVLTTAVSDWDRSLKQEWEGIQGFLTHPRWTPDSAIAESNASKLADIASVESVGRHLYGNWALTPEMLNKGRDLLSPVQQAQWDMNLMPGALSSLDERTRIRSDKWNTISINDVAGAKIQHLNGLADMYASQISTNPQRQSVLDAFAYMAGRNKNIEALPVNKSNIEELLGRTAFERGSGKIINYQGSALFDPDKDIGSSFLLDLGRKVRLDIGMGNYLETDKMVLMNQSARRVAHAAGGAVYKTPLDAHYVKLLKAVQSGKGIQEASQNVANAMGKLGGKDGLVDTFVNKTQIRGEYGTVGFMSPAAEEALAKRYGETGGFIGMPMDQLKNIYEGSSENDILQMIESGIYMPLKREPAAPRGISVGRVVLRTEEMDRFANWGKDVMPVSAGIGSYVHGDLDNDKVTIQSEWAIAAQQDPAIQDVLKKSYHQEIGRYNEFHEQVLNRLKDKLIKGQLTNQEVISKAIYKGSVTGPGYVLGMQTYEGARELGHSASKASNLAQVMFGLAESGINAKRTEAVDDIPNIYDIISSGNKGSLRKLAEDIIDEVHPGRYTGSKRTSFINDLMASAQYGSEAGNFGEKTSPYAQNRSLYDANTIAGIDRSINVNKPSPGTIMSTMARNGATEVGSSIVMATKSIGEANATISATPKRAPEGSWGDIGDSIKQAAGDYMQGLREGKGWTSLAVAGVIAAGVGLGLEKPGNIIVQNQNNRNETEPPIIRPRHSETHRVMTEGQYHAIINIRDARKVDRKKFIDLGQAISGKYSRSSQVNIHLKDDTNQVDYKRVFDSAYRSAMQQGMQ